MLSLITKTSLISCYCLSTCQQSSCRSTAPILHSFIVSGVIPMTTPFIVRCQSTSQHTEPASMLVVHRRSAIGLGLKLMLLTMLQVQADICLHFFCLSSSFSIGTPESYSHKSSHQAHHLPKLLIQMFMFSTFADFSVSDTSCASYTQAFAVCFF